MSLLWRSWTQSKLISLYSIIVWYYSSVELDTTSQTHHCRSVTVTRCHRNWKTNRATNLARPSCLTPRPTTECILWEEPTVTLGGSNPWTRLPVSSVEIPDTLPTSVLRVTWPSLVIINPRSELSDYADYLTVYSSLLRFIQKLHSWHFSPAAWDEFYFIAITCNFKIVL